MRLDTAPRSVLIAGVLVGLQGIAGLVFTAMLLIREVSGQAMETGLSGYGHAAYFTLLSGGVLAFAVGLLRGRPWSRTPALFIQILLLGVAWYAFGPSGRPVAGIALAVYCTAAMLLLHTPAARLWGMGLTPEEAGEQLNRVAEEPRR
ncbi:peptidoglycan/LPS O-acetylase OafA/YrhL [Actinoalloteichus hoggarensis]|uniref:Uncharacterized protein n=1 Tax=Actinoalloteichus hoggarensis TaxID=1470176 RepID=A0A221W9S0_9PSEU|nr:hypothetical protein [Actinoalloteichus hoggarensis]ASO22471.1 hypothetical protein AHOG_24325 [Actinoalloteichus hoggarensis]MBB5923105.1 peptidoglycan/LPS O-acetylase OafA/YrhL [Actinoalloteichus hoggarensis]